MARPKTVVFSGPTATIANSPPLVTSNFARRKQGLPLLTRPDGEPYATDILRSQRLAAPVRVYVEAFSSRPLEADAAELYAPPDGWLTADGAFTATEPADGSGKPVYEVELRPEDGLLPLPYIARRPAGRRGRTRLWSRSVLPRQAGRPSTRTPAASTRR